MRSRDGAPFRPLLALPFILLSGVALGAADAGASDSSTAPQAVDSAPELSPGPNPAPPVGPPSVTLEVEAPSQSSTSASTSKGSESDLFELDTPKVTQALQNDLAPEAAINSTVVTAGEAEARSLAAADITVVDRDEIALHGWRSLTDVLSNVPGIYVSDDLVLPSVGVRGVSGGIQGGTRIVKIMINGVPVSFRPDLSSFIGPELIPMEAVERIEIAKGPLSALYGANAFLAVVNVITRRPTGGLSSEAELRGNLVNQNPGYGGSGMVSWGENGRSILAAVSADHVNRSGLELGETFPAQAPKLPRYSALFNSGPSENDLSSPVSAYGQLVFGRAANAGNVTVQGGYQKLDSGAEFQLNSALSHDSRVSIENFWASARYEKTFSSALSLLAWFGYSTGAPTSDYRLYLTGNQTAAFHPNDDYRAWDGTVELDYTLGPLLGLKLGVDGEIDRETVLYYTETLQEQQGSLPPGTSFPVLTSNEPLLQNINDLGVYLQATSVPFARLPGLHLTGNLRLDKPNLFDFQWSWRAAAAYRFSRDLTLKVFAGRAFQAPSGVQLFAQSGFGSSGDIVGARTGISLPPLNPQVIQSIEADVAAKLLKRLSFDLGVYAQQIDDHISFLPASSYFAASNGLPTATNDTASQQQNLGVELTLRAFLDRFSPYATASYQQTIVAGSFAPGPPPLYPNIFGRVGTDVSLPEAHLKLNAQLRFVGDRGSSDSNTQYNDLTPYTLPAFADVDLAVSAVDLHLLEKEPVTQLRVAILDLLDERHFEPGFGGFDIPNPGRTILLELHQDL